jgi:hypothetical protein
MLKGKTFRISIMLSLTLTMALFSVASVLTTVSAGPTGTAFDAIFWGAEPGEQLREWIDGRGFTHLRFVIRHTGASYPGGLVDIYSITEPEDPWPQMGIVVKGTVEAIIDMEDPDPTFDGHMAIRAKITLYGDTYRLNLSGPINEGMFSIPFVILGRGGRIVGIASGEMGNPACQLSGTWVR